MPDHEGGFRRGEVSLPDNAAVIAMMQPRLDEIKDLMYGGHGIEHTQDDETAKRDYAAKINEELPALVDQVFSNDGSAVKDAMSKISFLLGPAGLSLGRLVGENISKEIANKTQGIDLGGFGVKYGAK